MSPSVCPANNVEIVEIRQENFEFSLAEDIYNGIKLSENGTRSLPTMLLYDAKGLNLFEEITYLDEYYLTNTEIEVLETHAQRIVERIPANAQLVELGSGNLRKIEILLKEFERTEKHVHYYALDLSLSELKRTFSEIPVDQFEFVKLHGLHGTYADALTWLSNPKNRTRPTGVISMGSSLGNFSRPDAASFLHGFSRLLGPSDFMVLGLDGCKNTDKVYKAYNDSRGVTRQFYENGLAHANEVLGYEAFKPSEWEIVTRYNEEGGLHQTFVRPKCDVTINGIKISKGENLLYEEAFKYDPAERESLWRDAGLIHNVAFGNTSDDYHIHMLSPANLDLPTNPLEYAASPIPRMEEFQSLWTAWDIVTKGMVPGAELLSKPINLRNVLLFYLGHIPTFSDIHVTRALRGKLTEPRHYQLIFERGIDPDVEDPEQCHAHSEIPDQWPPLVEILEYQWKVRSRIQSVLQSGGLKHNRTLGEALWIGFEHEIMHLETFLYMLLQSDKTLPPPGVDTPDFEKIFREARKQATPNQWFVVPEQTLLIGLDDKDDGVIPPVSFGWDNEKPQRTAAVSAFEAQGRAITNGEYAEYLEANHIEQIPASWVLAGFNGACHVSNKSGSNSSLRPNGFLSLYTVRTVFGPVSLELAQDWPVVASYDELAGYAEWVKCRIPTYEEVRSIYQYSEQLKHATTPPKTNGHGTSNESNRIKGETNGTKPYSKDHHQPVRPPVSSTSPVFLDIEGCNVGFKHWHPTPVIQNGNKLAGQSELGGVWEWTSTPLVPHDGFKPMDVYPGYTADFFDGKHNIVQGGSWATHPRIAGRTSFVNWYQHNYPYAWAGARLVRDL
ncbi:hypothetical protein ASPZODRAFT_324979 [Penicilliopsis zonata CBS 506.65]|uniref:Histidine-specific methyltransferase SAM-dependent domain-containing protein n=1 Tax=Penicilliopsis zonata CBS 506.65 TaxID=1073090 RepID=A0A1L9SVQ4_9EURO|nr:hypothetical protein ASPZODRAFT_324979 [Penicilliopsis zonata CBS 506.65]OJJ51143.1 hypothetical protein ASPZODRAFT_324979 [Penicilliopsis zonata CBS 506.65]